MKMTHFEKPDHKYHRVMFEFTDKEIKDAGYCKLRFKPTELETLRLLHKIADAQIKEDITGILQNMATPTPEADELFGGDAEPKIYFSEAVYNNPCTHESIEISLPDLSSDKPKTIHHSTPGGSFSKEAYLSELQETMKRFSREDHANLQRKKDGWKGKALRLIGFLNNKDEVIKRLLRENKHYRNTMTEGGL